MALQKRRWQMHSAVTPKVRLQKQPKARVHAVCAKVTSGQLPFLRLMATNLLDTRKRPVVQAGAFQAKALWPRGSSPRAECALVGTPVGRGSGI